MCSLYFRRGEFRSMSFRAEPPQKLLVILLHWEFVYYTPFACLHQYRLRNIYLVLITNQCCIFLLKLLQFWPLAAFQLFPVSLGQSLSLMSFFLGSHFLTFQCNRMLRDHVKYLLPHNQNQPFSRGPLILLIGEKYRIKNKILGLRKYLCMQ